MLQLRDLLWMTDEQLACVLIELVHLATAERLPGSEDIDVERCVDFIKRASNLVAEVTASQWHKFRRNPEQFGNSEAWFRCQWLTQVLWLDRL